MDILTGEYLSSNELAIIDLIYWSVWLTSMRGRVWVNGMDEGYRCLSQLRVFLYQSTRKSVATSK